MSKAESRLHLDDACALRTLRFAEVRGGNISLNSGGPRERPVLAAIQVDLVEEIIEVGANLQSGVLSNKFHVGESERFTEGRVYVEVAWTCERIALDSRRRRQRPKSLLACRANCGIGVREEASKQRAWRRSGSREEVRPIGQAVAVVVRRKAAKIRGGLKHVGPDVTRGAARELTKLKDPIESIGCYHRPQIDIVWRPLESGVCVQDAGNTPSSSNFLHPAVAAFEDPGRPYAVHLERVVDVVIGRGESTV